MKNNHLVEKRYCFALNCPNGDSLLAFSTCINQLEY